MLLSFESIAQNCDCSTMMKEVIQLTETEYALFQFKVNEENIGYYNTLKKTLLRQADKQDQTPCQELIDTYISFFKDGHLWVELRGKDEIAEPIIYQEDTDIDSTKVVEMLNRKDLDPIEGIWESTGYKIAIVKNQNKERDRDFVGVILASSNPNFKSGEVKMEVKKEKTNYTANYLMGDHKVLNLETKVFDTYYIEQGEMIYWRKVSPIKSGIELKELGEVNPRGVLFKELGNQNYYLKIGDFGGQNQKIIEDLVNENEAKLKNANILVIDVRDNGGGNDPTYFPLLPYIYSGKVALPEFAIWTSPKNKEYFANWLEKEDSIENTPFYQVLQSEKSQLFSWEDEESFHELDTIYPHPKKVAIIANRGSASSAETFVDRCQQSKRVVTFGQNTEGIVDGYNGNFLEEKCYTFRYPTSLRSKNVEDAIDPYGIYPDVFLPVDQKNPIPFILEFMEDYTVEK